MVHCTHTPLYTVHTLCGYVHVGIFLLWRVACGEAERERSLTSIEDLSTLVRRWPSKHRVDYPMGFVLGRVGFIGQEQVVVLLGLGFRGQGASAA